MTQLVRRLLLTGLASATLPFNLSASDPVPTVLPITTSARRDAVVDVCERVKHSVVNIHSKRMSPALGDDAFRGFGVAQPQQVNGMGTGIVLDPRGYIITNHHVVDDVQSLRACLVDGTSLPARIIATDKEADLALIKIEPTKPMPVVALGTANDLFLAEQVLAIGNAYGYEHTVTVGFVSAKNRDVTLNKDMAYKSLIQTQTPINPGNSGGPLFNKFGELVGVNVAIRANSQNIAFAITVDTMIARSADLLSAKKRSGVRHGVVVQDHVSRDSTDVGVKRWVTVTAVEANSPAAMAGVKPGDIIERIGDLDTRTSLDVERSFLEKTVGAKVPVTLKRGNAEPIAVEFVLQGIMAVPVTAADVVTRRFGARTSVTPRTTVATVNPELRGGLVVDEVTAGSAAATAGLARGDILIGLHLWESLSHDHVLHVLNHKDYASFLPLKVYFVRGGKLRETTLTPEN